MQENLDILSRAINEWMPQDRPVSQAPAAAELEKTLDLSLGEQGSDQESLESAIKAYLHYNPAVSQADFFKLLYSGQNKPALLGDWITSLSNATMHTYQVGPVATLMDPAPAGLDANRIAHTAPIPLPNETPCFIVVSSL